MRGGRSCGAALLVRYQYFIGGFKGNPTGRAGFYFRMTKYRYRTAHRSGKWYASLEQAQRMANAIGAGFLDQTGGFVAYRGTVLEMRD